MSFHLPNAVARGACWGLLAMSGVAPASAALEFVFPLPDARFRQGQEIFISLHASAENDVYTSAEVYVDGTRLATAVYCCPLCPCPPPSPGVATTLQIPTPLGPNGEIPTDMWQGWQEAPPGEHVLMAYAFGMNGTSLVAGPVRITVEALWLELRVSRGADGVLSFVIPEGSLVMGGFRMELSHDLIHWVPLGEFAPGNVAAFYRDTPDPADSRPRFYRAVRNR